MLVPLTMISTISYQNSRTEIADKWKRASDIESVLSTQQLLLDSANALTSGQYFAVMSGLQAVHEVAWKLRGEIGNRIEFRVSRWVDSLLRTAGAFHLVIEAISDAETNDSLVYSDRENILHVVHELRVPAITIHGFVELLALEANKAIVVPSDLIPELDQGLLTDFAVTLAEIMPGNLLSQAHANSQKAFSDEDSKLVQDLNQADQTFQRAVNKLVLELLSIL